MMSIVSFSLAHLTQVRLISLRWLSVLAMFLAALLSPSVVGSAGLLPQLAAFTLVFACGNGCLHLAALLHRDREEGLPLFTPLVQLSVDLLAWALFLYQAGGAANPLISVFLPLVAIGAMVLGQVQAWLLGLSAIGLYSLLWQVCRPLDLTEGAVAGLHSRGIWWVFVASALVIIWFIVKMSQALRRRDAALAQAREEAWKNQWLVSLGGLAAGTAHELSTPLATLGLLLDEALDQVHGASPMEQRQADLILMRQQIERCKSVLAKLTQQAAHPRAGAAMPAGIWLEQSLAAWQSLHPELSFSLSCDGPAAQAVLAEDARRERRLQQALAMPEDNQGECQVRARLTSSHLSVAVAWAGQTRRNLEFALAKDVPPCQTEEVQA